jgi:hypothetical protein
MIGKGCRTRYLLILLCLLPAFDAFGQDQGRIKRKPPSDVEADRIASDMAMNDSLLRKGDIVATDRGFLVFRGLTPDGISNDFVPVSNPLETNRR